MLIIISNERTRLAQARLFGVGAVRLRDMRWHLQARRAWCAS